MLFPALVIAQKFALIDKNFKIPILYSDSITVQQVTQGYFPIENKNVDSFIANILYLKSVLAERQRSKVKSFDLHSSSVTIQTSRVPYAYGDRYNSKAESRCGDLIATYTLIDSEEKSKNSKKRLERLLNYLKENKSFYVVGYFLTNERKTASSKTIGYRILKSANHVFSKYS